MFSAYETWLGGKAGSVVEKLGPDRARALLGSKARAVLTGLIAQDKALEPEFNAISAVDRLVRYHRDLRTLLHNFVNFADFYTLGKLLRLPVLARSTSATAPARALRLGAEDPAVHSVLAATEQEGLPHLPRLGRRAGGADPENRRLLHPGRQRLSFRWPEWRVLRPRGPGLGTPPSPRSSTTPSACGRRFWSPYKKVIRMIEEQIAKRAAVADAAVVNQAASHADPAAPAAPPAPKKMDIGTVAALGVAVGAIGGALATVATGLARLAPWQLPLVLVALILVISLPAVLIAALKLRQRTIGPLLEANGWAINGRVRINIPFGTALTQHAELPPGSRRSLVDPYADTAAANRRRGFFLLVVILLAALVTAKVLHTWPFFPASAAAETPAVAPAK